jgi:hypothetical protein
MAVKVIGGGMPLLVKAVLAMSRDRVAVGIPADSPPRSEPGAPPNAVVGYVMENGAPELNIPARPFLAPGIRDAQSAVVETLRQAGVQALKDVASLRGTAQGGGAVEQGLHRAGVIAKEAVKARVEGGGFAPLAERTLAARRARGVSSAKPLLDTEQMYDAIDYRVEPKGGR